MHAAEISRRCVVYMCSNLAIFFYEYVVTNTGSTRHYTCFSNVLTMAFLVYYLFAFVAERSVCLGVGSDPREDRYFNVIKQVLEVLIVFLSDSLSPSSH
jgi:hypothetical protein